MATRILQLLAGEVRERRAQRCDPDVPLFGENEMLIFVGVSLGRLLRPFELFMHLLLSWDKIRHAMDLEGVTTAQVSCKQPGPTFKVRHNRAPPTAKTHERMDHGSGRVTDNGDTNQRAFAAHAADTGYP
jgi:hypothetical protein